MKPSHKYRKNNLLELIFSIISFFQFDLRFIFLVEWAAHFLVVLQNKWPMAVANINIRLASAPRSGYNSVKSGSNS